MPSASKGGRRCGFNGVHTKSSCRRDVSRARGSGMERGGFAESAASRPREVANHIRFNQSIPIRLENKFPVMSRSLRRTTILCADQRWPLGESAVGRAHGVDRRRTRDRPPRALWLRRHAAAAGAGRCCARSRVQSLAGPRCALSRCPIAGPLEAREAEEPHRPSGLRRLSEGPGGAVRGAGPSP